MAILADFQYTLEQFKSRETVGNIKELDLSCFTGKYVTGTVTDEYLTWVEKNSLS